MMTETPGYSTASLPAAPRCSGWLLMVSRTIPARSRVSRHDPPRAHGDQGWRRYYRARADLGRCIGTAKAQDHGNRDRLPRRDTCGVYGRTRIRSARRGRRRGQGRCAAGGRVPFYEPDLEPLLRKHLESQTLRFTTSYEEAGKFGDVHFLCVGTPQRHGELAADLSYIDSALEALAPHLSKDSLVVGKSTVPVGTADRLARKLAELAPKN